MGDGLVARVEHEHREADVDGVHHEREAHCLGHHRALGVSVAHRHLVVHGVTEAEGTRVVVVDELEGEGKGAWR